MFSMDLMSIAPPPDNSILRIFRDESIDSILDRNEFPSSEAREICPCTIFEDISCESAKDEIWSTPRNTAISGIRVNVLSTLPASSETRGSLRNASRFFICQRMLFIESREFLRIVERRGAAIVQMAVINPVVIRTTSTQPGTSPLSSVRARSQVLLKEEVLAQ